MSAGGMGINAYAKKRDLSGWRNRDRRGSPDFEDPAPTKNYATPWFEASVTV